MTGHGLLYGCFPRRLLLLQVTWLPWRMIDGAARVRTKSVLPQIIALIIAPLLLRRLDPKVGGHRGVCCMQRQEMVICLMMVAMVGGAAAQDDCTGAQHP